ncbi:MAG: hypothetical protein AB4426_16375 [Xenococcaceae cyanobacterium]
MLTQFRIRYPQGSLISELVKIDRGQYVVRALVQVEGVTLATGLAAANTVEQAEDHARNRALAVLDLNPATATQSTTNTYSLESLEQTEPHKVFSQTVETSDRTDSSFPKEAVKTQPKPLFPETTETTNTTDSSLGERKKLSKIEAIPTTGKETQSLLFDEQFSSGSKETVPEVQTTPVDPAPDYPLSKQPPTETPLNSATADPIDFSDIIAKSDAELKRLGWTNEQGRDYLLQTYGKRSRHLLSDEELLEFLHYLENQPTI